ncbi:MULTISPECIES: ABC transporter transmembrane domain-containing protein [unclassified Novosphingobium]|uniref:ABC transporter transmembrane domain-containing protein n=1 Tax=unclassified Novosphingobium TaxID=2644732 RepID=UPI00183FF314|nr:MULTISPECIES: ABC transporter transmembrane domain-containing protein [unclassified Novosphingobium]NMN03213.1 putative ABC transport system ATP-binding protein [Novosphingobium sp. SG919]NMN86797.1 putative ABC transport system ATP-binding protein [Novosphingobium sp. SG916]
MDASAQDPSHPHHAPGGQAGHGHRLTMRDLRRWTSLVLSPDKAFIRLALVYGAAISLLSLATPISVQLLINSVANIALPAPLFTLALVLFALLLLAGALMALRVAIMARFEQRFFARLVAEITTRAIHAQNPFFVDARHGDLFNRFFDMGTVQKALTSLVIGGFAIVLQSLVGLVVTSFYHPFFLAFNVVLVLVVLVIWRAWLLPSLGSAVAKSHAKHAAAHWLESLGASNGFYKSGRHINFAIDRSEAMTATYVAAHRRHFRHTFSQTLCLLLVYALASAGLLAMGGWLILQGELSVGQLVAAELILSGVFYGIAQLGGYLEVFYDLAAGLEELALFWDVPQEAAPAADALALPHGAIRFQGVVLGDHRLDFAIESGEHVGVLAAPGVERSVTTLLKRLATPERGLVRVGGADLGTFDMVRLRADVVVLDRPTIVEMTVRDYLRLAAAGQPDGRGGGALDALALVGLEERVGALPAGLDTMLSSSGWPLAVGETMLLKLAGAILACPRVLVLSPLYDMLEPERLGQVLAVLRPHGTTVLHFTGRPGAVAHDAWLHLGETVQRHSASLQDTGKEG